MTAERIDEYGRSWQQRFANERKDARERARAARRALRQAVEILRRHGATRILLFGSLCSDELALSSDIDLAVEGLPAAAFTRALADLMMALEFSVDLKPLELVEGRLRDRISSAGEVLYEAP